MVFAPEDKKAWNASEVMAELEKIALETGFLDGPEPEAFEPVEIGENEKEEDLWEDEDEGEDLLKDEDEGEDLLKDEDEDLVQTKKELKSIKKVKAALSAITEGLKNNNKKEFNLFSFAVDKIKNSDDAVDIFSNIKSLTEDLYNDGNKDLAKIVFDLAKTTFNNILEERQNV